MVMKMSEKNLRVVLVQLTTLMLIFGFYLIFAPWIIGSGMALGMIGENVWYLETTIPGLIIFFGGLYGLLKLLKKI